MVLTIVTLLAGAIQGDFPVGSYSADVSRAPLRSRDILMAYFGQAYLVVRSNGTFELCGIRQKGFWRRHADRFVLVYDGFFNLQSSDPSTMLRRAWPKSNVEGVVLRRGTSGTLVLSDWGRVAGPVIFRPLPARTVSQLLVASNGDEGTAVAEESLTSVEDRVEDEWPEVLRFINDTSRSWQPRNWAAIVLEGLKDPNGIEETARLILDVKPTDVKGRDRTIRRSLARVVARHPNDTAVELLVKAQKQGLLEPADVAPSLGKLKRMKDVSVLVDWLASKGVYDRIEALRALTMIGAVEGLRVAQGLTSDPEESVQLAAYGLVARTSPDAVERKAAILKLAGWLKSSEFLMPFAAVDALCESRAPEALPYLVAMLGSDMPALNRRNTAIALGEMRDARAVSALIEAKTRKGGPGTWAEESEVRRAAAEALVKLGKRHDHARTVR